MLHPSGSNRPRVRRVGALHAVSVSTATALLASLALVAGASADERAWRVGVIDENLDPATDVRRMGTAHVSIYRTAFNWERVEPDGVEPGTCPPPASYDWSYYDRLVLEASQAGIALLPTIVGSPDYVASDPRKPPDTRKPEIENYRCYVRQLVGRYGRGGDFPASRPAARPIEQWQVGNEPSLPQRSVNGRVSPGMYAELLTMTHNDIRSADGQATVVMAGLPERPTRGMRIYEFLRKLYAVRGIERKFDVLALHPYARNHRGVEGALIRLRALLRRVGDSRRYLWITEVGWATHGAGAHSFLEKSERGQARELTQTLQMIRQKRRRYKVGTVTWFRWRDQAPYTTNLDPFNYAGLYRSDGSTKPSCRSYVRFTGGECQPIPGAATQAAGAALLAPSDGASVPLLPSSPE